MQQSIPGCASNEPLFDSRITVERAFDPRRFAFSGTGTLACALTPSAFLASSPAVGATRFIRSDVPMNAIRNFLRHSPPGRIGLALTSILVVAALAAPWLATYNPIAQNLPVRLAAPSSAHWMGTDQLGRDILSRILFGARVSTLVSISVVLGAGLI